MPEPIQLSLFYGFAGLMFILRLDARRFGAAEWDTQEGGWTAWLRRLTWYAGGVALALMVFALHPRPVADLNLVFGADRGAALLLGLIYAAGGVVAAFALALITAGHATFPTPARYPGGALYAVGTAFYDEFLFRGVTLGVLLSLDLPDWAAVVGAALVYATVVRASAGGRGIPALVLPLVIGLVGGALVLLTAGIAAAFLGHAATRFALFLTMGPVETPAPLPAPRPRGYEATADSQAWIVPPRQGPPSRGRGQGGGGGPFRPA